jgi:hypothetical protein
VSSRGPFGVFVAPDVVMAAVTTAMQLYVKEERMLRSVKAA